MFLGLEQSLGFQFAIARVQGGVQSEAERLLALYLRGLMSEQAVADRVKGTIKASKRRLSENGSNAERAGLASATAGMVRR